MKLWTVFLLLAASALAGDKFPRKEPGSKAKGKVYEWTAKNGLVYLFRVPKQYDAKKGASLTLILHGSNLDRRWGFWNHKQETFRPDDIVVSPDGTTANGRGGFNLMGESRDAKRLRALHVELKKIFNVKRTFLYGHSQGSFFSFFYAGIYPKDVDGVVGHASGRWGWTQGGPQGHHIPFVFMHGTDDPVVPYRQSVGGHWWYTQKKYPMVRLRSLEGWNHWPAEHNGNIPHTSQQLAWVEGMATNEPERMQWCFDFLCGNKNKERHDWSGTYTLAKRIADHPQAPDKLKRRAAAAMDAINKLAEAHVAKIKFPAKGEFKKGPWPGHTILFLRAFADVPAREAFVEEHKKVLDRHAKDGQKAFNKYWPLNKNKKDKKAFETAVAGLKKAFLYYDLVRRDFLRHMQDLRKRAKSLRASKRTLKDYDALVPDLLKSLKKGAQDFDSLNRKCKLP